MLWLSSKDMQRERPWSPRRYFHHPQATEKTPMPDDFHRWTSVGEHHEGGDTAYMRVPGGRIYQHRQWGQGGDGVALAMVFVPNEQQTTTIHTTVQGRPIMEEV